jgi:hypothetical protein
MERRFTWAAGFLMALIALAVGVVSYNAGVAHGLAVAGAAAASDVPARALAPYPWHGPWGFGFGLGPLAFLFVWFLIVRFFFWGRRGWHYPGPYDGPMGFDEWHRRAHEQMNQRPPAQPQTGG